METKAQQIQNRLNNRKAKREPKIKVEESGLPFNPNRTYLGVTQDRTLTYPYYLETLQKKLISRVALIRRLAGTN